MSRVRVVNIIPLSMSGETNQDSEPNIAVDAANVNHIVATAFTPAPAGGLSAPIYISTDGGSTWSLRTVLPGNGQFGTNDVTVAFAPSGNLYAGTLNGQGNFELQISRQQDFTSTTQMTVLVDRSPEDQPWIVVQGEPLGDGRVFDDVFVGNNDVTGGATRTAEVARVEDAAVQAGTRVLGLEARSPKRDGPPIRLAVHPDGTVYAAYLSWTDTTSVAATTATNVTFDVVVRRDDTFANDVDTFFALLDSGDGQRGQRVVTGRFARFDPRASQMGQERLGSDLAIAVDPQDSGTVWVAWCDRVGGAAGTDWTLHVRRSTDRGQNWLADVRTITNAKNPALAVNSDRLLGLLYQAFTGTQWVTTLELTRDAWATAAETHVLHQAPSNTPALVFWPYLGDYVRMLAIGKDFYGVFSGNNTPDLANFPSGVSYQRNADFTRHTLLSTDGVTPVAISIDPFFFNWDPGIAGIITRGPRSPIFPRSPIIPPSPIIARGPISPITGPREPVRAPPSPVVPRDPGPIRPADPQPPGADPHAPPTDLDL